MTTKPNGKSAAWRLLGLLAIAAVVVVGTLLVLYLAPAGRFVPEIVLTVVLVVSVLTVVALIVAAVLLLARRNLADKAHAFALPQGTVRAIIALTLVLAFTMTSIFLFGQLKNERMEKIVNLSAEQYATLDADRILASGYADPPIAASDVDDSPATSEPRASDDTQDPESADGTETTDHGETDMEAALQQAEEPENANSSNTSSDSTAGDDTSGWKSTKRELRYDVWVRAETSEASRDFAKQLLTTMSTLVVAIAGFYFGTKAVAGARSAISPAPAPVIRSVTPDNGSPGSAPMTLQIDGANLREVHAARLEYAEHSMALGDLTMSATVVRGKLTIPSGQQTGSYDLVVSTPTGDEDRLVGAFTVKSP
jgi:amino acid transporter